MVRVLTVCLAAACLAGPTPAQVTGLPAGAGSGPISDLSTSVSRDSRPVHESGQSLRDLSHDSLSDGSVSGSGDGSIHSGPVSDVTVGSVHDRVADARLFAAAEIPETGAEPVDPGADLGTLQDGVGAVNPLPADAPPEVTDQPAEAPDDPAVPQPADDYAPEDAPPAAQ